MKGKWRSVTGYGLLAIGYLFVFWLRQDPLRVENLYSRGLYPVLMERYSRLVGHLPFSLAEALVVLFYLGVGGLIVYILYTLIRRNLPKPFPFFSFFKKMILLAASLFLIFQLSWGLNYHRVSFAGQTDLYVSPTTTEELASLCRSLTRQAVELRQQVTENEKGVFVPSRSMTELFQSAQEGYEAASSFFPMLAGNYGTPKGVFLSHFWSYMGTSGMYFPLTGEANVNITTPPYMIPATITHEMAHQHGYAREDEANFIAYVTAISHPSADFQYSGTMLALNNAMNQLYRADASLWEEIRASYSEGMLRDLADHHIYRDKYQGSLWETSNRVNDRYLMMNDQSDGVQSYGRMVDLLLALRRLDPHTFDGKEINPSFCRPPERESQKSSS
ncbi:DUF3810 domain-containing protein [Alkalibacter rhizosphaerae]|uniref:DUF3810 domain-containing protein n=1 Tax=Alkalibacter rhizosphaerae TaxID=2815577 RepID=A0A974XD46_9FIRM|nr:DUF3810 domain-containing protein [Alkalibacter rhizosphaerae]QSX07637.1 DUF3810 domain-containing protein [Alkalibacter rhizosphaerae]